LQLINLKIKHIVYILFLSCFTSYAQIISINDAADAESGYSLQELVEEVLVSGDCAEVNNFSQQAFGRASQPLTKSYGYFKKPDGSDFPFDEGIIITSGRAHPAGNTTVNTNPFPSYPNGIGGDTDLELALGINNTFDATFVKFNFVPTSPDFNFRFIMASEEYDGNFECVYSDSFAFLLREVGTSTYINLAVLPNGQPVSVTNINNSIECAANADFFEGYNLPYTNYGGQTKVLTASASVTPNVTYEIKLVVADQGDSSYDSAIFLEAGGFNIGLDLGEDVTFSDGNPACSNETFILDTQIPLSQGTHTWFLNGLEIVGETESTLNVTSSGTYSVVVDYGSNCAETDSILIEFTTSPIANPIPDQLICDDNNDGFWNINLEPLNDFILDLQLVTDFTISYHASQTDADTNTNPLPYNYTNQVAYQAETIYARIESNFNPECFDTTSFEIIGSYPPESISVEVITNAFENNNIIEVTIIGYGDYEISLDNGVWQNNSIFQHVSGGYHTIRVRDLYKCYEFIHEITVMDFPKVFTPNNDGYNDTWNIYSIESQLDAKIFIFDKYGKLLKQLIPNGSGWNGTFKGELLSTDDYWFTVEYIDPKDQVKKQFKSHFTLKR